MAQNRVFVKLNVDATRSGMIADMGPELWATLCVIAAHMDGEGRCYPSQDTIGRLLGVSRQTANKYVQRLLAYRWQGEPVLTVEKKDRGDGGRFYRNAYKVMENSGLSIF